jgi:hypothetical protein
MIGTGVVEGAASLWEARSNRPAWVPGTRHEGQVGNPLPPEVGPNNTEVESI